MKPKLIAKITVDIAMTAALLLLMTYELIGAAHEWLGIAIFALFVVHHILNGKWSVSIFKGKYTPIREDMWNYDVYEEIGNYENNVLLIHGSADNIVPLSYSEKALKKYRSARLEVLSGAGHGFYGQDAQQAVAWILEYLETCKNAVD